MEKRTGGCLCGEVAIEITRDPLTMGAVSYTHLTLPTKA